MTGLASVHRAVAVDQADVVEQVVCAVLGDQRLALPAGWVREVLERPTLTPVPLAPLDVLGVLPLRGEVLCVVDPGPLLGLPARTGPVPAVLVTVAHGRVLGIGVDEVTDVVAVRAGTERDAAGPATVDVDGRLHQVLHPDLLVPLPTTQEDA